MYVQRTYDLSRLATYLLVGLSPQVVVSCTALEFVVHQGNRLVRCAQMPLLSGELYPLLGLAWCIARILRVSKKEGPGSGWEWRWVFPCEAPGYTPSPESIKLAKDAEEKTVVEFTDQVLSTEAAEEGMRRCMSTPQRRGEQATVEVVHNAAKAQAGALHGRIDETTGALNERIGELDEKLEGATDAINARIDAATGVLNERIGRLERNMGEMRTTLRDILTLLSSRS